METRLAVAANFRKRVIRLPIRKLRTSPTECRLPDPVRRFINQLYAVKRTMELTMCAMILSRLFHLLLQDSRPPHREHVRAYIGRPSITVVPVGDLVATVLVSLNRAVR